jgi:hypothetical protein
MRAAALALGGLLTLVPAARAGAVGPPPRGFEAQQIDEQVWLDELRARLGARHKVPPQSFVFSPGRRFVAFVRSTPAIVPPRRKGRPPVRRRHQIVVLDTIGRPKQVLRPVAVPGSDEPPAELRFLGEARLAYEALPARGAVRPPGAPRLFILQPLGRRARPVRCEGTGFSVSPRQDRLAYAAGAPGEEIVAIDGRRVFPRAGARTRLASPPAWSKDGLSLAFLELPANEPPRLVLLADVDNATGDTTWDLPTNVALDGAQVFWTGAGKLVVGRKMTAPLFAASFEVERPR